MDHGSRQFIICCTVCNAGGIVGHMHCWELPLRLHDFYFAGTFETGLKTYRRWQGLLPSSTSSFFVGTI